MRGSVRGSDHGLGCRSDVRSHLHIQDLTGPSRVVLAWRSRLGVNLRSLPHLAQLLGFLRFQVPLQVFLGDPGPPQRFPSARGMARERGEGCGSASNWYCLLLLGLAARAHFGPGPA